MGGGFAGLTSAMALGAAGAEVTVLEALQGPLPAFRGELLHPPGVRMLGAMGLAGLVSSGPGVHVHGFAAFDGVDPAAVLLPYPADSVPGLGFNHEMLVSRLRSELSRRPRIRLSKGARVHGLVRERGRVVGVRCSDGTEHRASLLIGADGRHSKVRRLLGLPTDVTLLSYMVLVALEGDLLPERGYGHVIVGAPGPALAYPYGERQVRVCIDVPLGLTGGAEGIASFVRIHHARLFPEPLRGALVSALERQEFSVCANHAVYTARCTASAAALVGDAGGCSHPLTATGMTSALHDVSVLADCLSASRPIEDALHEYQRRRYRFVRAREVFAHAMYDVFRDAGPGALSLRSGMFRYWRAEERARRASIRILSGEDSRVASFLTEYARVMRSAGPLSWHAARTGWGVKQVASMLAASVEGLRPLLQAARAGRAAGERAQARERQDETGG